MSNEIRGIDVKLLIQDPGSPSVYVEVDVMSEVGLQITNSVEDKTTKGDVQKRTLSTKSALKSYSISGSFVCDMTALATLITAADNTDPKITARVAVSTKGYTGIWLISSFEYRGGSSGVANGTLALESASAITVATIP